MTGAVFDRVVAAIAIILASPLMLGAAIAIKLTSAGPVFYSAQRIGRDGKPFVMFKFRTMCVCDNGPVITAAQDTRVFAVGHILRRTKIDELPQLVNVLCGQMALVGPRAEAPEIVAAAYCGWMMETLCVLPGLTSPGSLMYVAAADQIVADDPEAHYIQTIMPLKLAVDRAYLEHRSFGRDMAVLWRTAGIILQAVLDRPVAVNAIDLARAKPWLGADGLDRALAALGLPHPSLSETDI